MADWNTPALSDTKVDVLSLLKARDSDAASLAESPTNPPTGYVRYNRTANKLQEWNGSAWVDFVLSVEGGGTGGASQSAARTGLGLGTLATQNSNAVSISGGTISGLTTLGVSGNTTIGGLIIAGSGGVTLTDSNGNILESAIADGTIYTRRAANETINGTWNFNSNPTFNNNAIPETKIANGSLLARLADNESVTGTWTFSTNPVFNFSSIPEVAIADSSILARVGSPEIITGSWTFSSPITGNLNGTAVAALALSPGTTINGVAFTGNSPITVTAAAGTLTGPSLASGVTASSLTSVGVLSGLTIAVGSATNPSFRFQGVETIAGMYYNGANPTVETGMYFNTASNRAVIRAQGSNPPKVDFLIGNAFPLEIYETVVRPGNDGGVSLGESTRRFASVWAVTGVVSTSDIRHKKVIKQIDAMEALDAICALDTMIARFNHDKTERDIFPALSAQDVKAVLDDQFGTNIVMVDQYDIHSMYYDRVIPFLCASIRGLRAEVQRLRTN